MASLITSAEKSALNSVMNSVHDTFSRLITVYKKMPHKLSRLKVHHLTLFMATLGLLLVLLIRLKALKFTLLFYTQGVR